MKMARSRLPVFCTHAASRLPSLVVSNASTRTASRSAEISVEVLAGQVAGVRSSHPGPPGIGLYPLLKTSIDNELVMLSLPATARPAATAGRRPRRCLSALPSRTYDLHRCAEPVTNTGGVTGEPEPQACGRSPDGRPRKLMVSPRPRRNVG